MKNIFNIAAMSAILSLGAIGARPSLASEAEFLQSLEGNWTGTGTIKISRKCSSRKGRVRVQF